ncbi:hypothetical protein [Evansella halocellulosilytica]|uniref:hypothetical protein n=1 Tax=Evansella halocellulosilytica TaxID=2011013 RepID=UPI000BB6C5E2|nr:hypothetical protein [Evansella halocellulosilytica]
MSFFNVKKDWEKLKKDLKQASKETKEGSSRINEERDWYKNYWEACPRCGSESVETYRVIKRHKTLLFFSLLTLISGVVTGFIFGIILGSIGPILVIYKLVKYMDKKLLCRNCKNVWDKKELESTHKVDS